MVFSTERSLSGVFFCILFRIYNDQMIGRLAGFAAQALLQKTGNKWNFLAFSLLLRNIMAILPLLFSCLSPCANFLSVESGAMGWVTGHVKLTGQGGTLLQPKYCGIRGHGGYRGYDRLSDGAAMAMYF